MEIGVYSFGNAERLKSGELGTTAQAIRNLHEAIVHADKNGVDFFGVGEHHTEYFPASNPGSILAAAAASTKDIKLGSAVSVLSTDDPVRLYQQFATADVISGGRVEVIAGRGSSTESFPLFGYDLKDYNQLFREKLDLLLELNRLEPNADFSWEGTFRSPITKAKIVPQPDTPLKVWQATGGNPNSTLDAARAGLPIAYAIIGGHFDRFVPLINMYRDLMERQEIIPEITIASPGLVLDDDKATKAEFWKRWNWTMTTLGKVRGFVPGGYDQYKWETSEGGAVLAGDVENVARRIADLHAKIGHSRHILQMDVGQLEQKDFLRAIELVGTQLKPRVNELIAEQAKKIHVKERRAQ